MGFFDNVGGMFSDKIWNTYRNILDNYFEQKWNSQWQKTTVLYPYRSNSVIDVRDVFSLDTEVEDIELSKLSVFQEQNDQKMIQILEFVTKNITYISDNIVWKVPDYWQSAIQTWDMKTGDCEDFSLLIYKLARLNNISAYRLRIACGWIESNNELVGHAYVLYLKEKDNEWYSIDGTWYPDRSYDSYLGDIPHKERNMHGYRDIWWTTNENFSWAQHDVMIM